MYPHIQEKKKSQIDLPVLIRSKKYMSLSGILKRPHIIRD